MAAENTEQLSAGGERRQSDRERVETLMNQETPLSPEDRKLVVDVAERRNAEKATAGAGAEQLNRLGPGPTAARDLASRLAGRDGDTAENPFNDESLAKVYEARQRMDRYDRDREAEANADKTAQARAQEAQAVERALGAGNRPGVQRERAEALGTTLGAAEFASAVSERVREKIAELPALAATAAEVAARTAQPQTREQRELANEERDPRLERESTEVLLAARSVGIERESGRPNDENQVRVELIERELDIRRSEGQPVQAVEAKMTEKDYEDGARLIDSMAVEKQGDKSRVRTQDVVRDRNELEMD